MKQRIQHFLLLLLTSLVALPAWADREVNQLQFGKQVITVASDEVITFYDFKGSSDISSSSSNNSHSLTVFQPAEAGKSISITFEEIDIYPDGASYPAYMTVYSGNPDADNSFTWASTTGGVTTSTTLPTGDVLKTMGGSDKTRYTSTNETFVSASSDGSLSVGFLYKYASTCKGWVAKVKTVTLENMTVISAGSNYENVQASPSTKTGVILGAAFVEATGIMNPDNVTSISFKLNKNEGVVDPLALKVYAGKLASVKGATPLEATVSADSGSYKFTLNAAPSEGDTYFTIAGDILGTAEVGAQVELEVTAVGTVAHPTGLPFSEEGDGPVTVTNPALVLMSSEAQTVTVGSTPLQFYDEGGKDGSMKQNSQGQVTFVPGVEGQKVMVEFTINKIWQGTYYNQELRIYNGREVKAENLIKTLQAGEVGIIRSSAEDGSLTVLLYSDTSSSSDYDGWEATVSLFTPQPMDFAGITTKVASTETVAAGDENQLMLGINVKTANTEPAMQVTNLSFETDAPSAAILSKASLFFTGASAEAATTASAKVGEVAISGTTFTITLTDPATLTEGDNWFWVAYDLNDEAKNADLVFVQATAVTATVNGVTKTEEVDGEEPFCERSVNNLVLSHKDQGTVTKTVNGALSFNTQTTSTYSSYCEAGTDTRTNIFVPKHEGMVCQIDFSEFNVQYASTSYSNKSTFKIYAGQGTDGTLLWELNDNSQESTGPGKIVRSTAEDGALTIVFSPKASYSYYYKGWKATVSEYLTKDMQVASVEVAQASTSDASIGAAAQELLTLDVVADGTLNPLSLDGVKLNLKGTEVSLTNVSVWQGETKLGEATATEGDITVTFDEAVTLAEGSNAFAIKADVSSDATEDATIDAKLVAVVVSGNTIAVENGDPEGSRTLKNMLLMTEGDHGTLNIGLGKVVSIYDDGGLDGDGADGVNATVTLAPTGEADCLKLTNLGISFSYTAHLYIYKGSEVNADNLIVDLTGSSAKFDPIVSDETFDGGRLTLRYVGAGSYSKPNFAITAEGYKKTPVAVVGVTTEDISVPEVLKGQTDTKMLRVAVEAKGELGSVEITDFQLTGTDGPAVAAYHVYQTDKVTTYSANTEFGEAYTISGEGTYYFWITYDAATTAEVGQTASATLTAIVVDGTAIAVTDPATASFTIASGKSGEYLVAADGTGNYTTIQAAIDDFGTLGMEGPVTLKIKAGEYNEKVRIPYIKGMGAVNTLTIESESGERDVKVYHNQYTTAGYSDDQHKKDYGVITLYEASYVTLRNLEVTTTDVSYKAVIMVKDESRHATIEGCYLHAPITNTGDVVLVGHTIIDEENKNNDYLTVRNSLLEGGKMGISMGGTNYVALPKEVGGIIEGNTIKNSGTKALYVQDELGAKIRNNTIIIENNSDIKMSLGALDMQLRDEYTESTEVTGNVFNIAPPTYCAAIYLRQMTATADAPTIIANNAIDMVAPNASSNGIYVGNASTTNMKIAHNTIRLTGSNSAAAIRFQSNLSADEPNIEVANNIVQNEAANFAYFLNSTTNASKVTFANNVSSSNGSSFASIGGAKTFAEFEELTGETGGVNKQVTFLEGTLQPADDLDGDLLTASILSYVTTDAAGKERPAENRTIGAYEFSTEDVVPVMAEGYPTVSATHEQATVAVKADAAGKAYVLVSTDTDLEADDVVADGQAISLTANAEATATVENLTAETDYLVYVVLESARGTQGDLTWKTFATAEAPVPELMAMITEPEAGEATVALGSSTTLEAYFSGGRAPFTAQWRSVLGDLVAEETFDDTETAWATAITATVAPTEPTDYVFTVTDARGKSTSARATVVVTGMVSTVATFENLALEAESYFLGEPEEDEDTYEGAFYSGSYKFDTANWPEYNFWYNFTYSNQTDVTYASLADQFKSCVGHGVNGSATYGIAYPQGGKITVLSGDDEGDIVPGFYITNTAYAVEAMENGLYPATAFTEDDWFKVTIKGEDADEDEVGTVEFYLAKDGEIVKDWTYVDLSSLGTVKYISFTFDGSDKGTYGLNTPAYFAFDNFGAEAPAAVVTLADTEDYTADVERTNVNVTYTRTFEGTEWQYLYLPFDVQTDAQEGLHFARLNAAHQFDDDEDGTADRTEIEFIRVPAGTIAAGTPCLVRAEEVGAHAISATAATLHTAELNTLDCTSMTTRFTFTGSYTGSTRYRWTLGIESRYGSEAPAVGHVKLYVQGDENEVPTTVEDLPFSHLPLTMYDLSGRRVNGQAQQMVKPGLYIRGGRKVLRH